MANSEIKIDLNLNKHISKIIIKGLNKNTSGMGIIDFSDNNNHGVNRIIIDGINGDNPNSKDVETIGELKIDLSTNDYINKITIKGFNKTDDNEIIYIDFNNGNNTAVNKIVIVGFNENNVGLALNNPNNIEKSSRKHRKHHE
jgi:hypothetical protein